MVKQKGHGSCLQLRFDESECPELGNWLSERNARKDGSCEKNGFKKCTVKKDAGLSFISLEKILSLEAPHNITCVKEPEVKTKNFCENSMCVGQYANLINCSSGNRTLILCYLGILLFIMLTIS